MALMPPPSTIAVVYFIVSFMSHGICASQPASQPDASQVPALLDLKNAWNGNNQLDTWQNGSQCSDWKGLTCDSSDFVTIIILPNLSIEGNIPSTLGNITSLTYLDISGNQFTGTLGTWLGKLTGLVTLDVSNNTLSGPLPDSFYNLGSLQTSYFSDNQFTGELPTSFSALTAANNIDISNNQFTGPLDASLGQLTNLYSLSINKNYFVGTIPTNVTSLGLGSSLLTDGNCFSDASSQRNTSDCESNAYGVTIVDQLSACGGTSNGTINGTIVLHRYYFFSVSVGSIGTDDSKQPNNATITITHSVTGLPGYNGTVNLDGAVITFTDSVTAPTLNYSGVLWHLSLPNNDHTWQTPVFGGGSLVRVLDASPPDLLSYSFTMTSDSVHVLGAAYLWSMVQYGQLIVANPPIPVADDYINLQITPKDLLGGPYTGYFSGQPTSSDQAVYFPYPGKFVSFNPTYKGVRRNDICPE